MNTSSLVEEYVRLALAIEQHRQGYIDAYFGPPDWKAQAEAAGKLPLDELKNRLAALADAIAADSEIDAQRRDFLARHVMGMRTSLRVFGGEVLPLAEEAAGVYDIRPQWTDESRFVEAQRELEELVPGKGSVLERLSERKRLMQVPLETARDLLPVIHAHLRSLTRARFDLPEGEELEFKYVSGQAWTAYNWYLGGGRSRIEINTDLPQRVDRLVQIVAHEAYPGHHTELSIKDLRLHRDVGRLEHCLMLLNSPSSVVSEGIATTALSIAVPGDALDEWLAALLKQAGLNPALARGAARIAEIEDQLGDASDNAAFMLHERGATGDEVMQYVQRYELLTPDESRKRLSFMSDPMDRAYLFTYGAGQKLLHALFAKVDWEESAVTRWFTRLVCEPVTPSQIRDWIRAG